MILLNLWIEIDHSGGSATGTVGCGESASDLGSGESAVRPGAFVRTLVNFLNHPAQLQHL